MRLISIQRFDGTLKVLGSGLRIGGSSELAGIGELDNPIIRAPLTRLPYVPGSSVKGKLRSLLELRYDRYQKQDGKPCACGKSDCFVCLLFGCHDAKRKESPTRLVFRDARPTTDTQNKWGAGGTNSEVKPEVTINRNTGVALDKGFRENERIPAGSEFDFSFSLRIFHGDDLALFYSRLAEGFRLLFDDYLGGCGSRGYGEVLIVANTAEGQDPLPMDEHLKTLAAQAQAEQQAKASQQPQAPQQEPGTQKPEGNG